MINSVKDLRTLLKLLREQGVTEFENGPLRLKLGDLPVKMTGSSSSLHTEEIQDPYSNFPQGELSPEQLMFYSAGGVPENDPSLKVG